MTDFEIYENVRGVWKASIEKTKKCQYALAVYQNLILAVYKIEGWYRENTTMYSINKDHWKKKGQERWEFVGKYDEKFSKKLAAKYLPDKYKFKNAYEFQYIPKIKK